MKRLSRSSSKIAAFTMTIAAISLITVVCLVSVNGVINDYKKDLEQDASKIKIIVEDEVGKYFYGLQGAKGVVVSKKFDVSPGSFRDYARSRDFFNNFPGALGFGFIRYVPESKINNYLHKQTQLRPHFQIYPQVQSQNHMIIELIEPIEQNLPALGLDIAFENNRLTAALEAARTGKSVFSRPITLMQKQENHTGFLYFIPIYDTEMPPTTESERMSHLVGWAYAPIVLEKIIASIKPKVSPELGVKLEIEAGQTIEVTPLPKNNFIIYHLDDSITMTIDDLKWKLHVQQHPVAFQRILLLIIFVYSMGVLLLIVGGYYSYLFLKQKDKSIEETSSWLKAVIHSAGHAVITTSPEGIITIYNSAAEKLLGYPTNQIIGKAHIKIFYDRHELTERCKALSLDPEPFQKNPVLLAIEESKKTGKNISEWNYLKNTVEKITVKVCTTAIRDAENNLAGYLLIVEDLTEQKRMLSTIELQRAKMLASSKMSMLGEMAGGIAHEINTPLAIILSKVDMLLSGLNDPSVSPQTRIEHLNKIKSTTHRIAKIVKGLRVFSRDSERDPMEQVSLNKVIESTLDLCKEKLFNLKINLKANHEQDYFVMGHATQLSQVLMNLISNAADAIEHLQEKWIEIKIVKVQNKILIKVIDSGNGIALDVVEKMMNPFFTTKEVGKGTGLGLSISSGIIDTHHGKLYYDGTQSNTCFVIELPSMQVSESEERV